MVRLQAPAKVYYGVLFSGRKDSIVFVPSTPGYRVRTSRKKVDGFYVNLIPYDTSEYYSRVGVFLKRVTAETL